MRALDILIAASSSKMDWRSSQGAPDLDGALCGRVAGLLPPLFPPLHSSPPLLLEPQLRQPFLPLPLSRFSPISHEADVPDKIH